MSFESYDHPYYLEFTQDNTLFVATSKSTSNSASQNGKLWRVDTEGGPTLVTALPGITVYYSTVYPPAIGVAIEATSRTLSRTFTTSNTTQSYDFGAFVWEMTNQVTGTCSVDVTATQTPPVGVNASLASNSVGATVFTFLGEGGFATKFTSTPECFSGPTSIYMAAYLADPFNVNPRLVRNFLLPVLATFRYDPRSFLPGDPGMGANTNNFSDFVLVDKELDPDTAANFCGFLPPLVLNGSYKKGSTIPVKFQLSTGNCKSNFVTTAQAIISVSRITPTYARINADASGSSNTPPLFRLSGKTYIFNLKLKGYTPGTYLITVLFLTNNATIQSIQINVTN